MAGGLSGELKEMPAPEYRPTVESKTSIPRKPGGWTFIIFIQEMAVMISTKNEMIKIVMRMLTV